MHPDLSRVDALCRQYGYPDEVRSLLRDVTTAAAVPGARSIVLSGSGSRGELIFSRSPKGVRWFSDLEFTVIADDLPGTEVAAIEARLAEIEGRQLAIGAPTFHVDVDFASLETWQQPRSNFQAWETRQTGWVLFGEDVRDRIQVEVDPRTCVQASLNRLWQLLLYLPEGVLRGRPSEDDREVFHYSLDRATLDFPLWLLIETGQLVCGFEGRLRYLEANADALSTPDFDVHALASVVHAASERRIAPAAQQGLAEHYETVLDWYVRMLRRSLGRTDIRSESMPRVVLEERARVYPKLGMRRRVWEVRLAFELAGRGRPLAAISWLGANKAAQITGFLWQMHRTAGRMLAGDLDAIPHELDLASHQMDALWPAVEATPADCDPVDSWLELRRRFFEFVPRFYRGLEAKRAYYREVLGETSRSRSDPGPGR